MESFETDVNGGKERERKDNTPGKSGKNKEEHRPWFPV